MDPLSVGNGGRCGGECMGQNPKSVTGKNSNFVHIFNHCWEKGKELALEKFNNKRVKVKNPTFSSSVELGVRSPINTQGICPREGELHEQILQESVRK